MTNLFKEKKRKKEEPSACDYCNCNWYCQYTEKERLNKPCYQELVKKHFGEDGIKIVMFY